MHNFSVYTNRLVVHSHNSVQIRSIAIADFIGHSFYLLEVFSMDNSKKSSATKAGLYGNPYAWVYVVGTTILATLALNFPKRK